MVNGFNNYLAKVRATMANVILQKYKYLYEIGRLREYIRQFNTGKS